MEISTGTMSLLMGFLFYLMGFICLIYIDNSLFLLVLSFGMSVCGVEAGLFWIRRFSRMQAGLTRQPPRRFIARAASAAVWPLFISNIVKIMVVFLGLAASFYFITKYLFAGVALLHSPSAIAYLLLVPVYLLIRKAIGPAIRGGADNVLKKIVGDYPTVGIDGNFLILHLGKGFLDRYRNIMIPWAEIEEIKVMDRYEGHAFLKYVLGPDVQFAARSAVDKIQYQQGKMPKPVFLSYMANSTGAKTLYLAGPEMLYLVGVQDNNELKEIEALDGVPDMVRKMPGG